MFTLSRHLIIGTSKCLTTVSHTFINAHLKFNSNFMYIHQYTLKCLTTVSLLNISQNNIDFLNFTKELKENILFQNLNFIVSTQIKLR